METERGREADYGLGNFAAYLHEGSILRGRILARRIETPANPIELSRSDKTAKVVARYVQPVQITRSYDGLPTGILQQAIHVCLHAGSVPLPIYISISIVLLIHFSAVARPVGRVQSD